MNAKDKLTAALELVRPDLREEFLKDLVLRCANSMESIDADYAGSNGVAAREYAECIAQALESVDVSRADQIKPKPKPDDRCNRMTCQIVGFHVAPCPAAAGRTQGVR